MKAKLRCLIIALILNTVFTTVSLADSRYELVIIRSQHRLLVKKDDVVLRSFRVALGSGGKHAKLQAGDHRTPSGLYHISKVRSSDRFYLFMQLDYPNMHDASRALKTGLITRNEYRNILDAHMYGHLPPQHTELGGSIGIHGIGNETEDRLEIHQLADWTQGCIALRNEEIDQLKSYVHIGTPVTIVE